MSCVIYNDFQVKSKSFEMLNIDTEGELFHMIAACGEMKSLIFRGINEAKYKLYNTAQRLLSTKYSESNTRQVAYEMLIRTIIQNAKSWNHNLLIKQFDSFNKMPTDVAVLSFLQHYGAPTPLLDWTKNLYKSLFFAIDGLNFQTQQPIIEQYFSLYCIEENDKIPSYLKTLKSYLDVTKISLDYRDILGSDFVDSGVKKFLNSGELDFLKESHVALIPAYKEKGYSFELQHEGKNHVICFNQHNLNVIAQEGLFFINMSIDHPLEYFFQGSLIIDTYHYDLPKIKCYNINKKLLGSIRYLLNEKEVNEFTVYPKEEYLAKQAYIF